MKKLLDILAIVIPIVLLLLPLLKRIIFGKAKKIENIISRHPFIIRFTGTFLIVALLLIGILRYIFYNDGSSSNHGPKPEPLGVSKHSSAFNESLQNVLNAYYEMTDAFASDDTTAIRASASLVKDALDNFNVDELKKDSVIYLTALDPVSNSKAELESIILDPSLQEKRGSLNILSDNLRNLLVVVKYDLSKVYWQECDEAFGDGKPGNWLSRKTESRNPYRLKNDKPCGAPKDTINYMVKDLINE